MDWDFPSADICQSWGAALAQTLRAPAVIYLEGDLGVGKTTLAQGILRALGVTQSIKSPTYTLLETYETKSGLAHHLDLYRLNDPEELEFIGIRDYLATPALWLIEWPERGKGHLPGADLKLHLHIQADARHHLSATAQHVRAEAWVQALPVDLASIT
ncbi:tRNA (adenosine(37)-N6)-threonylcarbamoyltransferase complex ATPase subunit type 1 TsaE [Acidithiobacillus thiooxidans]|jgi:tRNA threonylcarbamoyladenosine biosynthesis protein TsaE|uniref:tRNA threonylcarbamoyladenosine biosynthesis protein TsaE n=1 Tax=Acidithiobacillus thiooxidans ATCC 19377 TaxID=637390 RepID=A0A543Q7K4_ACITH|nr:MULTISPECIES: tRNA (adenosine(37)-N6)-threonylcarbamoyltransferase complex ATPase subunit type 1 TsaE [Acidithiobacillus]MBE7566883.1 tRNA (adenosine(37)-N6)-threonylcarbamoyltransferase complex ATPase subunit type 1 TsaE [Acidithiobacillus sp. HP-11]MBU2742879.1 tRNA (adenosine(37)-N6)-threonylcarbamoyltransferase complex ATPase subunit type 1 TsaE [Acidithiobacillus albertensis]MBU2751074.1 tRNA (adenosine(37)-N6)-threonylcarbamoyltransferase complex ATPase subunit type 1 TsaE [Acidithiobac